MTSQVPEMLHLLSKSLFPESCVLSNQITTANHFPFFDISDNSFLSLNEVKQSVFSLKLNSTPGLDAITAEYLRQFFDLLEKLLFSFFSACIHFRYFPSAWKKSLVIIIPKIGKDNYDLPSSYRPISLLSTVAKKFEKTIHKRLLFVSNEKNWFDK